MAQARRWRGVVTLSYHRVTVDGADAHASATAAAEMLHRQLRLLSAHCEILMPEDLTVGTTQERGRHVIVTFDDCYRDNFDIALPALKAAGVRATFFVVSGFLDGTAAPWWDEIEWMVAHSREQRLEPSRWWSVPLSLESQHTSFTSRRLVRIRRGLASGDGERMLDHLGEATGSGRRSRDSVRSDFVNWDMAREIAAAGMEFGGHTDTHPVLATLSADEQRQEIERGLERIDQELGTRPKTFAYPVGLRGTFDESAKRAVAAAGVRVAFSNYGGYTTSANWDPLEIRRVGIDATASEAAFRWTVGLPAIFAPELHAPATDPAEQGPH